MHETAHEHIDHPFAPIYNNESRLLILGTMPSPTSRDVGFYYAHPRNRFWSVMAVLFNEKIPENDDERTALALRHGIAIWDVLKSCEIIGASDASIKNPIPNDLGVIMSIAPIEAIATTGTKAAYLYKRLLAKTWPDLPLIELPSSSGANARLNLAELVSAYKVILPYTK